MHFWNQGLCLILLFNLVSSLKKYTSVDSTHAIIYLFFKILDLAYFISLMFCQFIHIVTEGRLHECMTAESRTGWEGREYWEMLGTGHEVAVRQDKSKDLTPRIMTVDNGVLSTGNLSRE